MPSLSGAALQELSSKDKKNLTDIQDLINNLFVRNKNQHRRSHWFESIRQFRKQLGLLLDELAMSKKSSAAKLIEQRLRFWEQKCVHKWYLYVRSFFILRHAFVI